MLNWKPFSKPAETTKTIQALTKYMYLVLHCACNEVSMQKGPPFLSALK